MRSNFLLRACLVLALPLLAPYQEAQAFDWLGRIELEAEGLDSGDPQKRLKAVKDLQRYAIEWTREHLLRALQDTDMNVRREAGQVLASQHVTEAVPVITLWLSEPDVQSKQIAADILGELGAPEAVPALIRTLGDLNPAVRVHALRALAKIGGESVIVPLVTRLEDAKAEVQLAAVHELRSLADPRAVVPLVGLFDASNLDVRSSAIRTVGALGDPSAVPALKRELGATIETIKVAAVTALGELRAQEALPELEVLLVRESPSIAGKVAFSIAQIAKAHPNEPASKRSIARLVDLLAKPRMARQVTEALRIAGPMAVPHLVKHLQGSGGGHVDNVVDLLRELGDARATPALVAELARGRISQNLVLSALRSCGDHRALLPVLALLEDSNPSVRLDAMRTLGPMLEPHSEAADLIAEHLDDSNLEIQALAAQYLGRLGSASALPALSHIVQTSKRFPLQALALAAIGKIGDRSGVKVAIEVLLRGPKKLRPVAADVLSELVDEQDTAELLALASNVHFASRILAIDALGASVRDSEHEKVRAFLNELVEGGEPTTALAAIAALAGMKRQPASLKLLMKVAQQSSTEMRRAAIVALGALGEGAAEPILRTALHGRASVSGAAGWALATAGSSDSIPSLVLALRSPHLATAVNASAALAVLATPAQMKLLTRLLQHRTSLIRVNAMIGLARLGDKSQEAMFVHLLAEDRSWLVRVAAIRALRSLGLGEDAIALAAQQDYRSEVRSAVQAPTIRSDRNHWVAFRVVNERDEDRPAVLAERFFVGGDGLALVAHTDRRGWIRYQNFPVGDFVSDSTRNLQSY